MSMSISWAQGTGQNRRGHRHTQMPVTLSERSLVEAPRREMHFRLGEVMDVDNFP